MIDTACALIRVMRLRVFATALSWALIQLPAPTLANMEDSACFSDPVPSCADTIMHRALALVNAVANDADRNSARVTFASMQSRLGDFAGARASIDAITDPTDRKSALTHVLTNMAARGTADETLALAESYGGGWLTGHALYAIAAGLINSGDVDAARSTALTIRQDDRRAKALEYIVGTQIASGDLAGARTTIQNERKDGIRSPMLLTLAGAHLSASDFESAFKLLGEITDKTHQTELLIGFANALAQAGDFSSAVAMAFRITNKQDQERALSGVAAILTFRRDFEVALAIAKEITDETLRNEISARIAAVRAEAGSFDQALSDARNIREHSYRDDALHRIAMTLALRNDAARALDVAGEIQDEKLVSEIVNTVALAELRAGNEDNALSVARSAGKVSAQVLALLAIADYRQSNSLSPKDIFLEIEGLVVGTESQKTRDRLLAEFSTSLARLRNFERAIETAEGISMVPIRGMAKADIAKSLAFFEKHERAAKILESIDNPKIRADAQQSLAMNAVTAGEAGAAMAYSKGLEDPGRRAIVFGFVAETLLRASDR